MKRKTAVKWLMSGPYSRNEANALLDRMHGLGLTNDDVCWNVFWSGLY